MRDLPLATLIATLIDYVGALCDMQGWHDHEPRLERLCVIPSRAAPPSAGLTRASRGMMQT